MRLSAAKSRSNSRQQRSMDWNSRDPNLEGRSSSRQSDAIACRFTAYLPCSLWVMSNTSQLSEPPTPKEQLRTDAPTWIERLATVSEHYVPDALTSAIVMMVVLAASALLLGNTVEETVDAYYRGLWMLLQFTMQMTLMLT